MKRFILLALTALLLLSTGCASGGVVSIPAPEQPDTTDNPVGVILTAKDVTPTGMTIVCTQSGGDPTGELFTGSYYVLEVYTADGWQPLEYVYDGSQGELAWTSEAWIINRDGTTEWPVNWEFLYGSLSAGSYRIGKQIMDWRGVGGYTNYMSYAQFNIE